MSLEGQNYGDMLCMEPVPSVEIQEFVKKCIKKPDRKYGAVYHGNIENQHLKAEHLNSNYFEVQKIS